MGSWREKVTLLDESMDITTTPIFQKSKLMFREEMQYCGSSGGGCPDVIAWGESRELPGLVSRVGVERETIGAGCLGLHLPPPGHWHMAGPRSLATVLFFQEG